MPCGLRRGLYGPATKCSFGIMVQAENLEFLPHTQVRPRCAAVTRLAAASWPPPRTQNLTDTEF